MAVKLRTFWYSYRLTLTGTLESVKALYCGVTDLCTEVPKMEALQFRLQSVMRQQDYDQTKECIREISRYISELIEADRYTKPIHKWLAELNGRLTSDMIMILEYLYNEGQKITESQRNSEFSVWSDDFLCKIVRDYKEEKPDKFVHGMLKFPFSEDSILPVEFLNYFFTFFMNTPLILPASFEVRRAEYNVELYQDDVYDMNEILQIREKACVWLAKIVGNKGSYHSFFILLGRAMKLGAWIGRFREMSYYRECRPDKLKEYYWAHQNCLSCQVRMPHCPFEWYCSRIGECQRHHIVQKYDWTHLDLIYLRNLTTQFTIDEIYWHFKQGVVWDAMQLEEFQERLATLIASQEPIPQVTDFENISDYEIGEAVPLQINSPGVYPAKPIQKKSLRQFEFMRTLDRVKFDAPEHSELEQNVMALALSGHCHFACLESTIMRSEVSRPLYVFENDRWLKLTQRIPTQFALSFSNYVFTRFRIGFSVRLATAIQVATEKSQEMLEMLDYKEVEESDPESDEMEVEETQSDEDSDFCLSDLMERL
uniref:Uncharacterized protein n=1 Tax=Picornavirales sp. TaxID=1955153 RepID=A0A6M3YRP9_9VIRU|nr:MAG: hypothetical protein 2 [Picornavirales sp.]